jgi:hypothetical protein
MLWLFNDVFSSFFSFLGWGETESTWYVGHYLAYCTSPGWYMMMSVEQSVEWELAGETDVLGENLPQCHFVHQKSHTTWPDLGSKPGRRGGKQATNRLSYGTADVVSISDCNIAEWQCVCEAVKCVYSVFLPLPRCGIKTPWTFKFVTAVFNFIIASSDFKFQYLKPCVIIKLWNKMSL